MSRYYCPFCSIRYQFHKTRSDGVLICGQCGDVLVKKTLFDLKRIIGLITAMIFLTPLLLMFFFLIKEYIKQDIPKESQYIPALSLKISNGI